MPSGRELLGLYCILVLYSDVHRTVLVLHILYIFDDFPCFRSFIVAYSSRINTQKNEKKYGSTLLESSRPIPVEFG